MKVIREKETRALSLVATAAFTLGVVLWLIYGLAIGDWPLIGSNAVTLALMAADPRHEAALRLTGRAKKCGPGEQGQPRGTAKRG